MNIDLDTWRCRIGTHHTKLGRQLQSPDGSLGQVTRSKPNTRHQPGIWTCFYPYGFIVFLCGLFAVVGNIHFNETITQCSSAIITWIHKMPGNLDLVEKAEYLISLTKCLFIRILSSHGFYTTDVKTLVNVAKAITLSTWIYFILEIITSMLFYCKEEVNSHREHRKTYDVHHAQLSRRLNIERTHTNLFKASSRTIYIKNLNICMLLSALIYIFTIVMLNDGDVSSNPGPTQPERVFCFNSESWRHTDSTFKVNQPDNTSSCEIPDPQWYRLLNKRAHFYWLHIKSVVFYKSYSSMMSHSPPLIPHKFKTKITHQDIISIAKIKNQLSQQKLEAEINILKEKESYFKDQYQKIDHIMYDRIKNTVKLNDVCQQVWSYWTEQCKEQAKRSEIILNRKRHWLKGLYNKLKQEINNETQLKPSDNKNRVYKTRYFKPRISQYSTSVKLPILDKNIAETTTKRAQCFTEPNSFIDFNRTAKTSNSFTAKTNAILSTQSNLETVNLESESTSINNTCQQILTRNFTSTQLFNLSEGMLTPSQNSLLRKGMKFTPMPETDNTQLKVDIGNFCRRLRLEEFYYQHDDSNNTVESLCRNSSSFTPQRNRDCHLDSYIDFIKSIPLKTPQHGDLHHLNSLTTDNLSSTERKALKSLRENESTIIKPADKGGGPVIMNSSFYEEKINSMLNDTHTYKLIDTNTDEVIVNKLSQLVERHKHCLTKQESEFIHKFDHNTSNFYGLPKIHKSKEILTEVINSQFPDIIHVPCPQDLTFRPIVGGPNCPTSHLSHLIDILLKPFLTKVESYLKDDVDFLNKLPHTIDKKSVFITADVVSLYTSIPHTLGIEAIEYWIHRFPESLHPRFTISFVTDSINLILNNNCFMFNNRHYLQLTGTAMGTKMAPNYANLVMGYLEQKLYINIEKAVGEMVALYFRQNWNRYLDDCFILWKTDICNFDRIKDIINSLNPSLKFTYEIDESTVSFLDVKLTNSNGRLITDLYSKPTDTHSYLHFSSCHPRHVKRAIPYTLSRRICTIVNQDSIKDQRLSELSTFLKNRGYPKGLIEDGIKKAKDIPLDTLRSNNSCERQQKNIKIPFISSHNPRNNNMFPIIRDSTILLQKSAKMQNIISRKTFVNSKRQPPNLKQILVRSAFSVNRQQTPGVTKCSNKRCGTCSFLLETDQYMFQNSQYPFKIKSSMTCTSKNLIYCMICSICHKEYIGETGDTLRHRVTVHKQQIRDSKYRHLQVSHHIENCSSASDPKFKILPFYQKQNMSHLERQTRENHFITQFKPVLNSNHTTVD